MSRIQWLAFWCEALIGAPDTTDDVALRQKIYYRTQQELCMTPQHSNERASSRLWLPAPRTMIYVTYGTS